MATQNQIIIGPASERQAQFLNSTSDITLAGGAAGSGKTYTSLLIALKFMQHPKATGVIFRRTSQMITAPGSIWHEAVSLFSTLYPKGLRIRNRTTEIVFPNGALLKFSHMQHESNMYDHKGGQYSLVIFDEATDFTESMITYLLSRMRNAYVDYKPQMFLMTNPDYHSFLRLWIQDFYLDPNTGIPIQERSGVKRFFFRSGNTMLWYDTIEEAESVHGPRETSGITSFSFIPATCRDNPPLLKADPTYLGRLMALPRVEKARLLDGSWFARLESSGNWKREWCKFVDMPNTQATQRVRTWDMAGTKPSEARPDPDWTRGLLISKERSSGLYTVEDMKSMRDRNHEVEKLIFATAEQDGRDVTISIPVDPNAQAAAYAKGLQRRLAEKGFSVKLMKPNKSKLIRFAPFSSISQAGFLNIVTADWNKEFCDELEIFKGDGKTHDDIIDCCSDAIYIMNQGASLIDIDIPDLASNQPSGILSVPSFLQYSNQVSQFSIPTFNL